MLISSFFDGEIEAKLVNTILSDFHNDGPVNQNHLESLAYIKKFQPQFFKSFESKLIFLMGLFYKTGSPQNFIEAIYQSYASSIVETTGRNFTPPQADAYKAIKKHTNFSFSAPTSAGKSYLFQEILREVSGDAIIVIPSRALISEYFVKVTSVVSNQTLVLPFIEIINTEKSTNRIYIVTPERAEELFKNLDHLNIELILLDEAQLSEEGFRGMKFDSFVRRIDRQLPDVKKVFTHPFVTNPEAQFIKHQITKNTNSEAYDQKTVGKIYIEHRKNSFKFFSPFEERIKDKSYEGDFIENIIKEGGTVMIYTSKSSIYNGHYLDVFSDYISLCAELNSKDAISCIARIEEYFGTRNNESDDKYSNLIDLMRRGIVIHHGSIPLKARLIIEEFVNKKHAKICFSTSTLIQGINMPFDVVWINSFLFHGSEDQKILNLKNLIGRAGRTSRDNSFDFGYVVIESKNKALFIERLNQDPSLSEISELDKVSDSQNEDYLDLIEAIKGDAFDTDLNLTKSQIERITNSDITSDIDFILSSFFKSDNSFITSSEYYSFDQSVRKRVKIAFENLYRVHLRRQNLTAGEKSVLSTAIPILLWQIQGKSFAEIVALRYSYLSDRDFRRDTRKRLAKKEIDESEYHEILQQRNAKFSCIAKSLPDKTFKNPVPLFPPGTSIMDIDFDKIVFDTYDYIDKVISLSLKDPLSGALLYYYQKTSDARALTLTNYIKYGTDDEKEIWLLKYGFTFDEIERIIGIVRDVNEKGIYFDDAIHSFMIDNPDIQLIQRYV